MVAESKSGNTAGPKSPSIEVEFAVASDSRTAQLRFKSSDEVVWITSTDAASLENIIESLGAARSRMLDPVAADPNWEFKAIADFNPRWWASPDTQNRFVTLWLRHPGLGWSGFGFPRNEAGNISKWLRKISSKTSGNHPSTATSFGGEDFKITTEGLGFYYYGKGDRKIGPNPFDQIEHDSDRAAGIVAASVVEQRLEEAIKSRLRDDSPEILQNTFRSSGPLGPFSTKIDVAYLLRLLSEEAHKDLVNLKNIRNDFAHQLELDSFDSQSIQARCKNFKLVDKHVGPVPPDNEHLRVKRADPYLGLPDHEHKLADARFRYVMTAQLLSFELGAGADNPSTKLPIV